MRREFTFLIALWQANLLAAIEYRVAFIFQVIGMMLNNGIYFLIWVIYFERFKEVRGWMLTDMLLVFGVVATSYGVGVYLFGNAVTLSDIIASGKLDYYLSMPRPVLLHALASRSVSSGVGEVLYGIFSFVLARQYTPQAVAIYLVGTVIATSIFVSFMVLVQSLAFWMGNTQLLSQQSINALITFSLYPITLFDGPAKFVLFTIVPAAFIGAVPAEMIRSFTWERFGLMLGVATAMLLGSVFVFYRGLRRYESGSAIQIQI